MSNDERLRTAFREAVDHLQPDVERELVDLRRRATQRRRLRWSAIGAAAAAVVVATAWAAPHWLDDASPAPAPATRPGQDQSVLDPDVGPLPPGEAGTVQPLRPRTYVVRFDIPDYADRPQAVVDVPEGWGRYRDFLLAGDGRGLGRWLGFWTVARVNTDPCTTWQVDEGWVDPGPGVDDLAQALVENSVGPVSGPEPVRVGGYSGVHLRITTPRARGGCDGTTSWESLTGDRSERHAASVDHLWILDVAGERLVLDAFYSAHERPADVRKLVRMAQGVTFTNLG